VKSFGKVLLWIIAYFIPCGALKKLFLTSKPIAKLIKRGHPAKAGIQK
jgi:hypothetical protein